MWQELRGDRDEIDGWGRLSNVEPSSTESKTVSVELQVRELDVEMVNDTLGSQSINVELDGALSYRGRQGNDQHDDEYRDEDHSPPSGVEIHWYYGAWEQTLLFNNRQALWFRPRFGWTQVPGL